MHRPVIRMRHRTQSRALEVSTLHTAVANSYSLATYALNNNNTYKHKQSLCCNALHRPRFRMKHRGVELQSSLGLNTAVAGSKASSQNTMIPPAHSAIQHEHSTQTHQFQGIISSTTYIHVYNCVCSVELYEMFRNSSISGVGLCRGMLRIH